MTLIPLKPDGSQDQLTLPGLDHPKLYSNGQASKRIRYILAQFNETFFTETAFYLTFNRIAQADRDFLIGYWSLTDDWQAFRRLCTHFKVKVA